MRIVVCVKHVPDATGNRSFDPADNTVDRGGVDGLLSELDEYPIEEALKLAGDDGEVVVLTVGPDLALDAARKALQMGAHAAVHVVDDAIHGSDAPATSLVLARAVERIAADGGPVDVVFCGMSSTDGAMGVVPAMLAERLGLPAVTYASHLTSADGTVTVRRDGDLATETVEASLPVLVSVTDHINEPRYPSFKGIMAAKKKPVQTWSLADLGLGPDQVGLSAAWTQVLGFEARPPRAKGTVVRDEDGNGGRELAGFLAGQKFV